MLQTLKWTESFFMGLAIVLIALAVVAVPSNHVWADPPGDPGEGGANVPPYKCTSTYCTDPLTDGCIEPNRCAGAPCNDDGKDASKSQCLTRIKTGCTCITFQ